MSTVSHVLSVSHSHTSTVKLGSPTSTLMSPSISSMPSPFSNSRTISVVIALICALLFFVYLGAAILTYRYSRDHPRGVNKKSGVRLQTMAPAFFIYIVVSSLIQISLAGWLLSQYHALHNPPNHQTIIAIRFLLFCSVWTFVTSGIYSILFLHPRWSELPWASIGSQFVWILVTWLFWIVGAGLLDGALPDLLVRGRCVKDVFCPELQGLFAVAVLLTLTLTGGMAILFYLAWTSARSIREMHVDAGKVVP